MEGRVGHLKVPCLVGHDIIRSGACIGNFGVIYHSDIAENPLVAFK